MSTNPVLQTIETLAKEKGIEPEVVIQAMEEAVVTASRKLYKGGEELKAKLNPENGQVELFAVKTIVEEVTNPALEISVTEAKAIYGEDADIEPGYQIEFPQPTEKLGRIAAQTAKQVLFQKVREAERENVFAEYNQRVGDVISGLVKRFEQGDIIVELGRNEGILPRKEQSRAESYAQGDRIRAVIRAVGKAAKGPQIVLSRTDPALLIKLFEQEVPEIYDGTVMVRGAVREAGDRAKVAVYSRERDVDPVGACVGMKGTRVQAIIRELRGEKIDIVEWSEDPVQFVMNALSPAKVQRVTIVSDPDRVMEVVVEDKQLSLAIGKKGQNVRLAAKLTGWRIDIKSEEEKRKEVEAQFGALEAAAADDSGEDVPADETNPAAALDSATSVDEAAGPAAVEPATDATPADADLAGEDDTPKPVA
ncbi:MAG: transcription termination/antitermination protein NusA [Acidobacteria bacterium]|nr:transcription termination/antitermination protein NusA [Acidobacteriota bacterium]